MTSSPIVAKWELSRRLANRRKELGMDVPTITRALGFSRNYWSAVENDRTLIAVDKLQQLFELMDIPEPEQAELLELRSVGRKRGWWDDYGVLDDETKRFIGLEDGATKIRTYESTLIPGLLQVDEYIQAILESDPAFSPVALDDLLAVRKKRQRILDVGGSTQFVALLSEAALHQQTAGAEVQLRQLDRILDRLEGRQDDLLELRVVPFEINPGAIVNSSSLFFFHFESRHLPAIAWQEAVRNLDMIEEDDAEYRRLDKAWQTGFDNSLNHDESIALLRRCHLKIQR